MTIRTQQGGDFVQAHADERLYALGLGQPTPRLLPRDVVAQSADVLATIDPLCLQYNRCDGAQSVRAAVSTLLASQRGRAIDPESLTLSAGNSQALDWVAHTLSAPGDRIVCENPTYFLAASIFADAGLAVHPVRMSPAGLDLAHLEAQLKAGLSPRWLYCIPAHHNPTGVSLSPDKVQALLGLAQRHDFLVVFDDPYAQLHFGEQGRCALDQMSLDPQAPWIRLGSFSKIFAPGLRLGWIEAPPQIKAKLVGRGMFKSGGGINPLSGLIVAQAIKTGALERHRDLVRATLHERSIAVRESLAQHLPDCKLWPIDGGYFGWIEWPQGFDARAFSRHCKAQGLHFLAGELACIDPEDQRKNFGRVSLSFYEAEELRAAMELMGRCYASFEPNS